MANTKVPNEFLEDNLVVAGDLTVDTSTLVVDSTNNRVGIGVTNPATTLGINGATQILAGNALYFQNSAADANGTISGSGGAGENTLSFNSGAMVLNASGNVGIGGNPHSSGRLLVTNGGTNQIVLKGASGTTNINMGNFAGGGYISNNYYYSSGHQSDDNTKGAFEIFLGDDNYGINYHSAGAMGTRRRDFAINSSGNVGIGTNSPDELLHLYNTLQNAYLYMSGGGSLGETYGGFARGYGVSGSGGRLELGVVDAGTKRVAIEVLEQGNQIIFDTAGTERIRIDSAGRTSLAGANGSTPRSDIYFVQGGSSVRWACGSNVSNNNYYVINDSNVGVVLGSGNNSWSTHSDERIKENIVELGEVLPTISSLRAVKFNLKSSDSSNPKNTKIGFIAQDWESLYPEVVDEDDGFVIEEDGTVSSKMDSESTDYVKHIAYTETIPVLLKAIQEQQTIIDDLKARIETLENS